MTQGNEKLRTLSCALAHQINWHPQHRNTRSTVKRCALAHLPQLVAAQDHAHLRSFLELSALARAHTRTKGLNETKCASAQVRNSPRGES